MLTSGCLGKNLIFFNVNYYNIQFHFRSLFVTNCFKPRPHVFKSHFPSFVFFLLVNSPSYLIHHAWHPLRAIFIKLFLWETAVQLIITDINTSFLNIWQLGRCFTHLISFGPYNTTMRWGVIIILSYRWEKGGLKQLYLGSHSYPGKNKSELFSAKGTIGYWLQIWR